MRRVEEIQAVAGLGLQGDRYSERTGVYSGVDECQVTLIEGEGTDEISRRMGLAINSRGLGSEFIRRFLTEMDLVISRDSRQIVDWLRHRTTRSPACLMADTAAHPWPSPTAHQDPRHPNGPASPAHGPAVQAARSSRRRTSIRQTWH